MPGPVICIGAALLDELFYLDSDLLPATTNSARVAKTAGGVSRNIAHQLALLDVPVHLMGVFGSDSDGAWLKQTTISAGVDVHASITNDGYTGKYTGIIHADGSLHAAFLTNAAHHLITPGYLYQHRDLLNKASFILADANIQVETLEWLLAFSRSSRIPLILETVSVPPAAKFRDVDLNGLFLVTPNEDELPVLCSEKTTDQNSRLAELLARGVENIWLHHGKHGSAFITKYNVLSLDAPAITVTDCTGAGDGSVAGFILGKTMGLNDLECLKLAHTLSAEILQVQGAVAHNITRMDLLNLVKKYYP